MTKVKARWNLNDVAVSESAEAAALRVVERLTRDKEDVAKQWTAAIRLAQANGASLRDIAEVAGVSPQTVANITNR